jgi:hypothetical protein
MDREQMQSKHTQNLVHAAKARGMQAWRKRKMCRLILKDQAGFIDV